MKIQTLCKLVTFTLAILAIAACVTQKAEQPSYSADSLTIDGAISETAAHFIPRLEANAKLALVHFDAPSGRLADYVFEELWTRFEDSQKFVMVDRRNLERIDAEVKRQYESGKVDDNLMVSITKQFGAEILVFGQITSLGNEYRITVYATDVELASSSQRAFTVRPNNRLASLLNASAEDEVERAVSQMARALGQPTTVAVGRIAYADTQTVSNLSAWLRNSIISSSQKHRDKIQVASDAESSDFAVASRGLTVETPIVNSSVQAVVTGSFSPLDSGAEVSLQLISTSGSRMVISSERFFIPASELERRKLTLLPEKDNAIITLAEFETKQQAVVPYSGSNNRWAFTVTPDVLDGIYYENDYMTLRIYSERDCYFRIIHVDVNGVTQVIYPLSPNDNNFIRAGETRRIPDNTRYRMTAPFGEEMILVSGYERPFTAGQGGGTDSLSADSVTRGLVVESDNRTAMSPVVTAKFSYTILSR